MERIHELLLQRCCELEEMREQLVHVVEASSDERKRIRGVLLRYRRQEQVRQSNENEVILYISKNNKFSVGWQRQFIALLEDVLPRVEGRSKDAPSSERTSGHVETIIELLVAHFKQLGEQKKIQQLERTLVTRPSNYQVCVLVNTLVESSRCEFGKLCRAVLDLLFQLIRDTETPPLKELKASAVVEDAIENQPIIPQKYKPARQETATTLMQEFSSVFGCELRQYYRQRAQCINDIDLRYVRSIKEVSDYPAEKKIEWLNSKLDVLVRKMITSNQHVLTAIEAFRERLSLQAELPLKIKRRFTTKTTNRERNKLKQQKGSTSAKNLLVDASTDNQRRPTRAAHNIRRITNLTLRNTPDPHQSKPRTSTIEASKEISTTRRIEYKINKSPLELNIELKYSCPNTSYECFVRSPSSRHSSNNLPIFQHLPENIFSSNRISGLLRRNIMQFPHYIQALKDIINL